MLKQNFSTPFRNNRHPRRTFDAAEIERLFGEEASQKDVARRLGVRASHLSRAIGDSKTLTDARARGLERAKNKGE